MQPHNKGVQEQKTHNKGGSRFKYKAEWNMRVQWAESTGVVGQRAMTSKETGENFPELRRALGMT